MLRVNTGAVAGFTGTLLLDLSFKDKFPVLSEGGGWLTETTASGLLFLVTRILKKSDRLTREIVMIPIRRFLAFSHLKNWLEEIGESGCFNTQFSISE